jgi:hypothetical protein
MTTLQNDPICPTFSIMPPQTATLHIGGSGALARDRVLVT